MKSFVNRQDLMLKSSLLPYTSPKDIPLSFRYGSRLIQGIPDDFHVTVSRRAINADIVLYDIIARNDEGLEIYIEHKAYMDFAAVEWVASFKNASDKPTKILSDIRVEGTLPMQLGCLYHGNGDLHRHGGYRWSVSSITEKIQLTPDMGTSCSGAFPYMRLLGQGVGVNLSIGWTGKWTAAIEPVHNGVKISTGQERCHMRIYPGETIRTPRLTLVAYHGEERRGRNMWRRWYLKHIIPRENGEPLKPLCCVHYINEGGYPEFTGATEQGQLQAIDKYLEKGIRPDVLWMDAGWYPCDHVWRELGDWRPDPERFPNGLSPIGKKCAKENIRFLLWFEPERAREGSPIFKAHPEWMLRMRQEDGTYHNDCLVDLGNPACCNYIIDMVDRIIKESGVQVYRQDFNFDPYPRWVQNEADDRIGALENLHIQGYYRFWDTLLERNPGLWIDSCASGGRRNDLETMRRSVPLHYTDVGYGMHPTKQLQHRQMFEWLPYFRAHVWSWDDPITGEYGDHGKTVHPVDAYAFYSALTPSITDMLHYEADEQHYALSRQMHPIWRQAAELMLTCDYFPLTECRESQTDFYAMAFYSQETGKGFLNLVSNNRNPQRQFTAVLDMLEKDASYTLTEAESGITSEYTGSQLALGLQIDLPPRSGIIYFIQRKEQHKKGN